MLRFSPYKRVVSSKLGNDAILTAVSQASIMLILLIVNKICSNSWTVDQFGLYNVYKRSAALISSVMLGGMGITLPRYLSISREKNNTQEPIIRL